MAEACDDAIQSTNTNQIRPGTVFAKFDQQMGFANERESRRVMELQKERNNSTN